MGNADDRERVGAKVSDPDETVWFGTSSFSSKDWVGPFYPEGTEPADFLSWYSRRYRTVEVDATYYAVPSRRTVAGWDEKTPEGFALAAKFPRSIVHGGEKATPDPSVVLEPDATYGVRDRFLDVMGEMGAKLGPLLLQFPYFAKRVFSQPGPFFERLDRFLADLPRDGFRYAVEIRNRRWLGADFAAILRAHGAVPVLVDHAWMPMGDELPETLDPLAEGVGYIRLLGDRKEIEEVTTSWDRIVVDRSDSLARWAKLLAELRGEAERIYVYANNHYAGHAPATLEELKQLYGETTGR
jgi:uncharacterized protein YecE (DUF72 family)